MFSKYFPLIFLILGNGIVGHYIFSDDNFDQSDNDFVTLSASLSDHFLDFQVTYPLETFVPDYRAGRLGRENLEKNWTTLLIITSRWTQHTKEWAHRNWKSYVANTKSITFLKKLQSWPKLLGQSALPPPPQFNVEISSFRSGEATQLCVGGGGVIISSSYMNSSVWEWSTEFIVSILSMIIDYEAVFQLILTRIVEVTHFSKVTGKHNLADSSNFFHNLLNLMR